MANVDITVQYAEGDSDYKICVPWPAGQHKLNQGVIADDTDIFQLLIHHADLSDYYENMYMITSRQTENTEKKYIDPALIYSLLEWMRHHFKSIWH